MEIENHPIPNPFRKISTPMMDNHPINHEWLRETALSGLRIPLIKAMRFITGCGLWEGKNEIEMNCMDATKTFLDIQKTIACFGKYINFNDKGKSKNPPTASEIQNQAIVNGIRRILANNNWSVLGFKGKQQACNQIISNFFS